MAARTSLISHIPILNSHENHQSSLFSDAASSEVISDSTSLIPDPFRVLSNTTKLLTEEPSKIHSDTTKILPNPSEVLSDTTKLLSESTGIISDSTKLIPNPSEILSKTTKLITEPTKIISETTKLITEPAKILSDTTEILLNPTKILSEASKILISPTDLLTGSSKILSTLLSSMLAKVLINPVERLLELLMLLPLSYLIIGSVLLFLFGLAVAGAVVGLIISWPLIVVLSPVWIPVYTAPVVIISAGFLFMCGFALVSIIVGTWLIHHFV